MAAVRADASYSRGGFGLCLAGSSRRVMVPGGSTFHLVLDYMDPNNLESQLGIRQAPYSNATYDGTQYKQNTNGYITRNGQFQ